MTTNPTAHRFITCESCGGEGRDLRSWGGPDDADYGPCKVCNGECVVEITTTDCPTIDEPPVKNSDRQGWWRYNDHYDRDGYCDNPARGY